MQSSTKSLHTYLPKCEIHVAQIKHTVLWEEEEKEQGTVPANCVICAGTEPWRVIVKAAIQNRCPVRELALEHIGAGIV